MVLRISISEAGEHFDDLVNRVRAGEEFVVEKAGEDVLYIGPVKPRQMLWPDLIELIKRLPKPDDEYFDEVEKATNNQGIYSGGVW